MKTSTHTILSDLFEKCWPWIEKAMDHGTKTHTKDELKYLVMTGQCHLYFSTEGCVVTFIKQFPQAKIMELWYAGGKLDALFDLEPQILEDSKSWGCTHVQVSGRMGWQKALKNRGYGDPMVTVTKRIE